MTTHKNVLAQMLIYMTDQELVELERFFCCESRTLHDD